MLRESATITGQMVELIGITDLNVVADIGIEGSELLIGIADAVVGGDPEDIRTARMKLAEALGDAAMVDAIGVAANFQRMVRVADATGIPVDAPLQGVSETLREELSINEYTASANTPAQGIVKRTLLKYLGGPMFRMILRRANKGVIPPK